MKDFTPSMDSTVGELIDHYGDKTGTLPSKELCLLIASIFNRLGGRWRVTQSLMSNHTVDVNQLDNDAYKFIGTSLPLDKDIAHSILETHMRFTHHEEWHKPISLATITIAPQDRIIPKEKIGQNHGDWKTYPIWYHTLDEQLKFMDNADNRKKFYEQKRLTEDIAKLESMVAKYE